MGINSGFKGLNTGRALSLSLKLSLSLELELELSRDEEVPHYVFRYRAN